MYTRVVEKDPGWLYYVADRFKTQKICDDVVCTNPYSLHFIPDNLKTQGMCKKVVKDSPWHLIDVPEHLKMKKMCGKVVEKTPCLLRCVPDCFKTKEMCEKVLGANLGLLKDVPDWIMTQQQIKIWHDDGKYCNDHELIKWYKRYEKRKAQKAQIKEGPLPIAWHQSRYWDWCMSEDEKKETEKLFLIY